MGKKKGGGKSTLKVKNTSSGTKAVSRAKKLLMRVKMKISRWKRNSENNEKIQTVEKSRFSRHHGWDTTKLEKHAELLENFITSGPRKV